MHVQIRILSATAKPAQALKWFTAVNCASCHKQHSIMPSPRSLLVNNVHYCFCFFHSAHTKQLIVAASVTKAFHCSFAAGAAINADIWPALCGTRLDQQKSLSCLRVNISLIADQQTIAAQQHQKIVQLEGHVGSLAAGSEEMRGAILQLQLANGARVSDVHHSGYYY